MFGEIRDKQDLYDVKEGNVISYVHTQVSVVLVIVLYHKQDDYYTAIYLRMFSHVNIV